MRRTILGGLVTLALGLPSVALAKPTQGLSGRTAIGTTGGLATPRGLGFSDSQLGTLGAGMREGNEPGHVTGPGNAPIDTSVRGPINDVQPGQGTNDTPQSRNPKPVP